MRFFTTVILFFFLYSVQAQEVSFLARSNAKKVLEGSSFTLEYVIENGEPSSFNTPTFKDFKKTSGLAKSSSMVIVNGEVSRTVTYSIELTSTKPGTYKIPPADIVVNGKTIKSNTVTVYVLERTAAQKAQAAANDKKAFIRIEVADTTTYIGQQIVVDYKLYTQVDIRAYDFIEKPNYDGFYAEDLRNSRSNFDKEIYEGQEYFVKSIDKVALFPQQTGTYVLGPYNFKLGASTGKNTGGFIFSNRLKYFTSSSNQIRIYVDNLPAGAPASFSGAVGRYQMQAVTDKNTITTDDAFTVRMEILGDGDGKTITAPKQSMDAQLDIYDPNIVRDETFDVAGGLNNRKTFEYIIVPKKKGRFRITPEFSYFDVDSNVYRTIQSNPLNVSVAAGTGLTLNREDKKLSKLELAPAKTDTSLHKKNTYFFASTGYYTMLALGLFSIVGILFAKRKRMIEEGIDPRIKKSMAAQSVAQQRLAGAKNMIDQGQAKEAYGEISNAIKQYFTDKWQVDYGELNGGSMQNILEEKNIEKSLQDQLSNIIKATEMSVYAGGSLASVSESYKQAESFINALESI
jgi:hypothetical protein